MNDFLTFISEQAGKLAEQTLIHLGLTGLSLLIALLVGLPLGILITRYNRAATLVLGIAGVLQTVPSIALLGFLIPVLGIGVWPAIVALFLYALLPIIRNTYVGIREVSSTLKEAALGMGMTDWQVLTRVELPLALPVIFAGVRTAAVINVGVATLAAYIAAGGLGEFIFGGIALNNVNMILAGAIPAALLAVLVDAGLARLQRLRLARFRRAALLFGLLLPVLSAFYLIPKASQTKLLAGFAHEFIGRADGYPGLVKTYGLNVSTRLLDQNLMYEAIHRKQVDIISGYSTDGRLKAYNLRVLTDDKNSFPPYYAAPLVRQVTLQNHPELQSVLDLLAGKLTDSVMTGLNYRVDYLHQLPEQVAIDFLKQTRLWSEKAPGSRTGQLVVGSKIFSEQYILAEIIRHLVEGHTRLQVITKTGLGGTKLCFDALRAGAIDLYPEYIGTGLLVILQPNQATLDSLKGNPEAVYQYVAREFRKRYALNWLPPLGFNNTYALVMRDQQAGVLGIRTISELKGYLKSERAKE
ncbi:hypothetical protein GCM10023189_21620 [Nibrella saemangeumensis]|uniref:ABC transmembrane type-1 domain-containing protein n=1 Tax=Nibrella saemangeumensis TaxID=1084526 RepID=A0ABP8MTT1_9BACT